MSIIYIKTAHNHALKTQLLQTDLCNADREGEVFKGMSRLISRSSCHPPGRKENISQQNWWSERYLRWIRPENKSVVFYRSIYLLDR